MIRAFIFDLDGVIVDTAKYHYLAWKRIAQEQGLHFTVSDNELLKGVSRKRSLEIILDLNGVSMSEEEKERLCTVKNNYYLDYISRLKSEEILPGAREFLEEARACGIKTALGSASKNSRLILNRLGITELFDVIIDGNKVKNAKPDPEVFLKGAEELHVLPQECVVFEDSAAGISAAHNGGMSAVGVSNASVASISNYYIDGFMNSSVRTLIKKVTGE